MKNIFILLVIFCLGSCRSNTEMMFYTYNQEKAIRDFPILAEMNNVYALPEENYYPKGDSICEKILVYGEEIVPALIECIKDTTKTQYRVADYFQYRVGDVSIYLIMEIYKYKENPNIRKILEKKFPKKNRAVIFDTMYHLNLFHNSDEINYKNRLKLYSELRKWYVKNNNINISSSVFR